MPANTDLCRDSVRIFSHGESCRLGLFGDLLKTSIPSIAGIGQQQAGISLVTGILEIFISQQTGDLQGLRDAVSSWVGAGPNLPLSGSQTQNARGSDFISSLAQKAGVAPDTASSIAAQVLPGIVDKLTPEGRIPEGVTCSSRGWTYRGQLLDCRNRKRIAIVPADLKGS